MLRLEDLRVDSFATTHTASASLAAANPTTMTVPYSMLGSCYDCPSNVTVCAAAGTE